MLKIDFWAAAGAKAPTQAYPDDAAWDLYAWTKNDNNEKYVEYDTGIRLIIPTGYVGLVFPRSSVREKSLTMSNSVGVIDAGYRGNIKVSFRDWRDPHYMTYNVGDKVAQIMVIPRPQLVWHQVSEILPTTVRGSGGHGSSGN